MARSNSRLDLMKRNNRALVALAVHQKGPISRVQLADVTQLSPTCIGVIVEELIADGILVETGAVTGARGRPMVLLAINENSSPAVGVRLAPEAIEIAVASPAGTILSRKLLAYPAGSYSAEASIAHIISGIEQAMKAAGRDIAALSGVGVSVHGLVDPLLGVIDEFTARPEWEDVPVRELLEEKLGVQVALDNCVRAGALSSIWIDGCHTEGETLVVVAADNVSSAVVNDGEVLQGFGNSGSRLGHMIVNADGPLCECGNRGCLDAYSSDMAFIRAIWPERDEEISSLAVGERTRLVEQGFAMAMSSDARASMALASVTKHLGLAIANVTTLFSVRTVLIGGTLVDCQPSLIVEAIQREALRHIKTRSYAFEVRPLVDYKTFLLRGSVGLILSQLYRTLRRENLEALTVSELGPGGATASRPRGRAAHAQH